MFYQLMKDDTTYTFQTFANSTPNHITISKSVTCWNWDCNAPVEHLVTHKAEFPIEKARKCYKALRNKGFQTFKEKYGWE